MAWHRGGLRIRGAGGTFHSAGTVCHSTYPLFISRANSVVGLLGIDAVRVLLTHPGTVEPEKFDFSVAKGTDLSHPLGSPATWMRGGSRAELAQLRIRPKPSPHPILVIDDDDAHNYGDWSTGLHAIPVHPGDQLTLQWQMTCSIGTGGPGQAIYPRLLVAASDWSNSPATETFSAA